MSTGDYADWGGGLIYLKPGATAKPESWTFPSEPAPPIASGWPAAPRINPPRITGGTPGRPFLFRIPATGEAPLTFAARNLPAGLTLDAADRHHHRRDRARRAHRRRDHRHQRARPRHAARSRSSAARTRSRSRRRSAGTRGTCGAGSVDDAKVRAAADAMVSSGLAAHGYQFINIDDGWEGKRDANGVLQPNEKFPDMKALTDYVHSKGLKIGIYSSPGARTCQGLPGSLGYEEIDARTWARLGLRSAEARLVFVRQHRCRSRPLADLQKPYIVMRDALAKVDRDIVYSLCQYGMGNVWEWGAEVGGNLWRTTGDLTDVWSNMAAVGFRQAGRETVVEARTLDRSGHARHRQGRLGPEHSRHAADAERADHAHLAVDAPGRAAAHRRGHDAVRQVHDGPDDESRGARGQSGRARPRRLARVYQRRAARALGEAARRRHRSPSALFNRGLQAADMTATWKELGISGSRVVRDLWQQKDLGRFDRAFTAKVPAHGAVMFKIAR